MILKETVKEIVTELIAGTPIFIVDISVSPSNKIRIFIDTPEGVFIDDCIRINRAVESSLDRDKEDFELEVSSPGLSDPLKVLPQYIKNTGRTVEVLTKEGDKYEGTLEEAGEESFILLYKEKIRTPDMKRPEIQNFVKKIYYNNVKYTKVKVSFK